MNGITPLNFGFYLLIIVIIIPALLIIASKKNFSLKPSPKQREFGSSLAKWAERKGFSYNPHLFSVISGIYHDRMFAIRTRNEENALEIRMNVKNSRRHSLQIFADWLEDSGVTAFINRFRIYSSPPGLGESLFAAGTNLREALIQFPSMRSRLELAFDPINKDEIRYCLLTDLSSSDDLDVIMDSMNRFCDAYEQASYH